MPRARGPGYLKDETTAVDALAPELGTAELPEGSDKQFGGRTSIGGIGNGQSKELEVPLAAVDDSTYQLIEAMPDPAGTAERAKLAEPVLAVNGNDEMVAAGSAVDSSELMFLHW